MSTTEHAADEQAATAAEGTDRGILIIAGVLVVIAGLLIYGNLTMKTSDNGGFGPQTFPWIVAGICLLGAALIVIETLRHPRPAPSTPEQDAMSGVSVLHDPFDETVAPQLKADADEVPKGVNWMKLGTALGLFPFARAPIEYASDAPYPVFPGYAAVVREVCAARDRHRTYVKARRFADRGGLVICDRYPIPQIKLMDGPLAGLMTEAKLATPLDRLLVGVEQRYYQRIGPPKLLMVLRLDPELAVQRKQIEDPISVRARNQEIWQTDWPETSAHVIDACRSKQEVSAALKSLVWSVI